MKSITFSTSILRMQDPGKAVPTLYEWAGGMPAFEELFQRFYDKVVTDPILAPVFRHMSPEHRQHVAHFVAEVLGGPARYTEADGGSHSRMVGKHLSRHLTEDHRKRWVLLLLETADEIGLPGDPEFRSAFVAYLEWGTRIAVINSQLDTAGGQEAEPMPRWGWGVPGGPYLEPEG